MEDQFIELTDFAIVCRICLEKREKLVSIFTEIFHLEEKSYREMLKECASVHISEDDSLPKNLCLQCSKHLERSYKLKIQCLTSEKYLQSLIANSQTKIKLEEPILQKKIDNFNDDDDHFDFYETKDSNYEDFSFSNAKHIDHTDAQVEIIVKEELTEDFEENDNNSNTNDDKIYKCSNCLEEFTCSTQLFIHNKNIHLKSTIQCQFCKKIFHSSTSFQTHYSEMSSCKICLKEFECRNKLLEHSKEHNVCNICGKTFNNAASCKRHVQIHTKEKMCLCTYCGKSFTDKRNMNVHIRIHTGEKPFQCKICDSKFKDSYHLKEHMTKHTTERKYECEICKSTYKWKEGLRQHKLSQHTDGEFACNYCDKRCKTKKYLRKHQYVHSGEWKHICTYCNKPFNRSDNLRVHLRIHTGEKPYVCNKCGKGFSAKHVMNGHMKTCNNKNIV